MAYLQLADQGRAAPTQVEELYVRVPNGQGGTIMVREDYFDNLPDHEWHAWMDQLEAYNFGMSGAGKDRRKARRDKRQARKDTRVNSKADARLQRSEGGGFLNKALGTVQSIFGPKPEAAPGDPRADIAYSTDGGLTIRPDNAPKYENWYENPWIIGGGVLGLGAIAYFATQNRR